MVSPTSSVPSATPSLTGLVVTFEATSIVTKSLTESDVAELETAIVESLNVTHDDVITSGMFACEHYFMCVYI